MATNAHYKVWNGTDWTEYYFYTSSAVVGESSSLRFLKPATHKVNGKSFYASSKDQGITLYASDIAFSSSDSTTLSELSKFKDYVVSNSVVSSTTESTELPTVKAVMDYVTGYVTTSNFAGLDKTGTVTSVTIKAGTGLSVDNSNAITSSGTRTLSLATSGVTAGTYKSVTVDTYGRVTAGTNPTTLAGYGITNAYTKGDIDSTISSVYNAINGKKNTIAIVLDNSSNSQFKSAVNASPDQDGFFRISFSANQGVTDVDSTLYKFADMTTGFVVLTSELNYPDFYVVSNSNNLIKFALLETRTMDLSSYATKTWVENKGYLTSHQSLAGYATETWVNNKGYATTTAVNAKADKATTLAGYGITDAKITNGTITLGSNSITPITSHQSLAGKQDKITSSNADSVRGTLLATRVFIGSSAPTATKQTNDIWIDTSN